MARRHKPIVERLQAAIRQAERRGDSMYAIAQRAEIDRSQLTRLMQGKVAPRIDTAERIAEAIGYTLTMQQSDNRR